MKGKSDTAKAKRVPLEKLLKMAREAGEESAQTPGDEMALKSLETGMRFRTCSVYGFYEPFIQERKASEEEAKVTQQWIADSIEAVLGEADIETMTMEELAGRIGEEINKEDLPDEDRWALYELCFMLTAQMSTLRDEFFSRIEQSMRWGTPDEEETQSLCRRVYALRRARRKAPRKQAPMHRVSLEKLLSMARGSGHILSEKARHGLPGFPIGLVTHCLLTAKYGLDLSDVADAASLHVKTLCFEEMFSMYTGEEWDDGSSISQTAAVMTWKFKLEAEAGKVSRARVLQAYELCYEFIGLLAGTENDFGHVSLMAREDLDEYDFFGKYTSEKDAQ